jgi:hypothetical protein
MRTLPRSITAILLVVFGLLGTASLVRAHSAPVGKPTGTSFEVDVDPSVAPAPGAPALRGRLVVALASKDSERLAKTPVIDAPFWFDPSPIFGVDVASIAPGKAIVVDDSALSFPVAPGALKPGAYRAAAWLITGRQTSNWKNEPGNLYSKEVEFTIAAPGDGAQSSVAPRVRLVLSERTRDEAGEAKWTPGKVELFSIRSELLSKFHGREVRLNAGVVFPTSYAPPAPGAQAVAIARRFGAVYEVPGFGGRHTEAIARAQGEARRAAAGASDRADRETLRAQTFLIVLDPESPNGHTLFADSDNNGPWGRALTEELIPALEARYPLIAEPSARLLTGHSSGAWSSVWLLTTYPQVFGAAWASAPDPLDFRAFQLMNIYEQANMFHPGSEVRAGAREDDFVSFRQGGKALMTVRQEVGGEHVVGPFNTSGGQWTSWQAVFGPRDGAGRPAALFDPVTGAIDKRVAERFAPYDIAKRLRDNPKRFLPIVATRLYLVCGGSDNFFLEGGVKKFSESIEQAAKAHPELVDPKHPQPGYVAVVDGLDHGTIMGNSAYRAKWGQMLSHLRRHRHAEPQEAGASSPATPPAQPLAPPPAAPGKP